MNTRAPPRVVAPLDFVFGVAYLGASLRPDLLPAAWQGVVVGMAWVSLGAAFVIPLAGAALLNGAAKPARVRRRVVWLGLVLCVLLPQMMLFRNAATTPAELLLPPLVVLSGMWSLWRAAGEAWPGLALEQRVARYLPLSAVVTGAMFFGMLRTGLISEGAIIALAGLAVLIIAIGRNLLAARPGSS